jgi:hypothetical protein
MNTFKLFNESMYFSTKYKKYFAIYDHLFSSYIGKKITFVEIGIENGGSLHMWRKFFGPKARIIGIDLNPECKIFEKDGFEIFIGNQAEPDFWIDFFNKVGKADIILDDGGHTNDQQIITTTSCIPFINDGGIMAIEDTHASYMQEFSNPSRYSFINFSKKIIDDINYTYPTLKNFKYSLNKYIYSIQFFEGFALFKVNRHLCNENMLLDNNAERANHWDYRYGKESKLVYLKKIHIIRKLITKIIFLKNVFHNKFETLKTKKYFK